MFEKKRINIKLKEATLNLYYYLLENPSNEKLIKSLESMDTYIKLQAKLELLPLVFTPNLDFLKEMVYDDNFFFEMVKIGLYLSLELDTLKFIPSHNYCLKACSLNLVNFKKKSNKK